MLYTRVMDHNHWDSGDIEKAYQHALKTLKEGQRPRQQWFTHQQFLQLFVALGKALENQDWPTMKKIFCLLNCARGLTKCLRA